MPKQHHDFGLVDERGRKVGGMSAKVAVDGGYAMWVQATRDGVKYGAQGPDATAVSEADADAWIAERITGMRSRYQKKYGNKAGAAA